jgi:TM2 domain-containing membrane protein YozV
VVAPPPQAQQPQYAPPAQPYPQQPQVRYVQQPQQAQAPRCTKSKTTAATLAILLGALGVHKFYLGKKWQGFLYLFFLDISISNALCDGELILWVPKILWFFGLCEGIYYSTMKEEVFCQKYGQK